MPFLCSAAQCCADAFQISAIPWPSFSLLRSALPMHICSILCLYGTLLCLGFTFRFRRRPVQYYAQATLPISAAVLYCADASLFKALAPLYQSMPLQVRSVLSRTIPLPCLATLCHSPAVLFLRLALPGHALPRQDCSPQCISISLLFGPMLCPGFSLLCLANAVLCFAKAFPHVSMPKLHSAILFRSISLHCRGCAMPSIAFSLLSFSCAIPALN